MTDSPFICQFVEQTHKRSTASKHTTGDAPVGFKEERQLVAIKLVLGVNDVHRKQTLPHFALADFKHLVLFFALQTTTTCRQTQEASIDHCVSAFTQQLAIVRQYTPPFTSKQARPTCSANMSRSRWFATAMIFFTGASWRFERLTVSSPGLAGSLPLPLLWSFAKSVERCTMRPMSSPRSASTCARQSFIPNHTSSLVSIRACLRHACVHQALARTFT